MIKLKLIWNILSNLNHEIGQGTIYHTMNADGINSHGIDLFTLEFFDFNTGHDINLLKWLHVSFSIWISSMDAL